MGDSPEADRIAVDFNDLDQVCVYKIIYEHSKFKEPEQHLNIFINDFDQVEAEVFYEDIDEHMPLIFKTEITENKGSYKLVFENKHDDNEIIYLIVNPLQPNANFDVKVS